ncbi:MAG: hypothetical protein IJ325_13760 [Clostridia bacterium]|nr:hypothetical protein [Clostridia bacterium]
MKKSRLHIPDILFVCAVLLFLFGAMAFTVMSMDESYSFYENRNLAEIPAFTVSGMLDGSWFSDVETSLQDHAAGRNVALKIKTWLDLRVFRRPVVNEVVIAEDDLLLPWNAYEYPCDTAWIEEKADTVAANLKSHAEVTRSYGGYFLYAAIPCQYVCYEDAYPDYLNNRADYTEKSGEALFARLTEMDVPYLDMLAVYKEQGILRSSSSLVDNHYSISGAFAAYRAAVEKWNADTGSDYPIPDASSYETTALPNPYLGSRTRKLCGLWTSGEKLHIMTPKENIPFRRYENGEEIAGTVYALPADDTSDVLYSLYMGGDNRETRIETDRENLPDILIYGDSFTNAMESVAWVGFDTMYTYDFRHYGEKTVEELILEYKPDIVICVRDYEALLLETGNGA